MTTSTTTSNKPFAQKKLGPVTVAVWKNETRHGAVFSYNIIRTYRTKNEEFAQTTSFRERDALNLIKLIDFAHGVILEATAAARKNDQSDNDADVEEAE